MGDAHAVLDALAAVDMRHRRAIVALQAIEIGIRRCDHLRAGRAFARGQHRLCRWRVVFQPVDREQAALGSAGDGPFGLEHCAPFDLEPH